VAVSACVCALFGVTIQTHAQVPIHVTAIAPSETVSTWIDELAITVKSHVDLPSGLVVPGVQPDSTQGNAFAIARSLKVTSRDSSGAIQGLEVQYLALSSLPSGSIPIADGTPTDVGSAFSGKVYEINCKTGTTNIQGAADKPPEAASAEEVGFVRRECEDIGRSVALSQSLNKLAVGQSTTLVPPSAGLFSQEMSQFAITEWTFTGGSVRSDAAAKENQVTINVDATADKSTQIGGSFPSYEGNLVLNDTESSLVLALRGSTTKSITLPNTASLVVSTGNMSVLFRRTVIGL
jgi:hypothetical protein